VSEGASSGSGQETAASRARDKVLSYFNPAAGTVADIADKTAAVRFPEAADIKKGMRFSVFRQGRPFYHPVTDELIGHAEEFAGRVEATGERTPEGTYLCRIVRGDAGSGDIVRITAARIKLAFFQERKADWELSEAFYSALKDSGRFEVLEAYTPAYGPEELSQVASRLNAEVFLLFSPPAGDEKKALNIKLYWTEDTALLAEIEEEAGEGPVGVLTPEEKFISSSLTEKEPWGSYRLAAGELFATGDVDGDGAAELVVSDGSSIDIYSFKDELQKIWSVKGVSGERHISIDILDLNNNGKAEIFITSLTGDTSMKTDDSLISGKYGDTAVRSFVMEFDPAEGYRRIKDSVPYFFRVSGRTLLMQKSGGKTAFSGPVYEGEWRDGDYQTRRQLSLPSDVNIYGFAFADWSDKGKNQVLTFDDRGYLILYDESGLAVWKSGRTYGGFYLSFETGAYSATGPSPKWIVRGGLMPVRTGRGVEVIAVNRTPLVARVPGFGTKGAEVYSLWWDGGVMDEKLVLPEVPGNVTDYKVEGNKLFLLAKGGLLSFVKNALTGELSKGSMLYYYNLGGE